MKKSIISLLFLTFLATGLVAQSYFKGTFSFNGSTKVLTFSIMPVGGNITSALGQAQFYIRYPIGNTITYGTPAINPIFNGFSATVGAPNTTTYPGYNLVFFNLTGTVGSQTFTQNINYPVFSVALTGTGSVPLDLITNYTSEASTFSINAGNGDPLIDLTLTDIFYPSQTVAGNDVFYSISVALPLVLTRFTAIRDGIDALLEWETASEFNTDRFEVERQEFGEKWTKIGESRANGTSETAHEYNFSDRGAFSDRNNSQLYYRLKMLDVDGAFEYSPIRTLGFKQNIGGASVAPNPSSGNMVFSYESENEGNLQLDVVDASSRVVFSKILVAQKGQNSINLDLQGLAQGAYRFILKDDSNIWEKVAFQIEH